MVVTGYTGTDKDIVIPKTIEGYKVSRIAAKAFAGSELQSVDIQAEITSLSESAFECSTVQRVVLPNTLKDIGARAFYQCRSLTTINFCEGLQKIGSEAFSATQLGDITLPSTLTSIGSYSFASSFGNITSVKFTGPTSIGSDTFQSLTSLKSVDLGDKSTLIGGSAFYCCSNLTEVKLSPNNYFGSGGIGGIFGG